MAGLLVSMGETRALRVELSGLRAKNVNRYFLTLEVVKAGGASAGVAAADDAGCVSRS